MSRRIRTGLIAALVAALFATRVFAGVSGPERAELLALYAGTNGSGWTHNSGWNDPPGTECGWYGVYCDIATSSTVVPIQLNNNNLTGALPTLVDLPNLVEFSGQGAWGCRQVPPPRRPGWSDRRRR